MRNEQKPEQARPSALPICSICGSEWACEHRANTGNPGWGDDGAADLTAFLVRQKRDQAESA